jgi:predicted ribosome quality control (RQC) complex YloA/Tae2 family protein
LIVELFSSGNIILLDSEDTILSATLYDKWKERTIRPKEKYQFPKSKNNMFALDEKGFVDVVKNSDKSSIVKALASDIGLGGMFAEEICLMGELDKKKPIKEISDEERKKLFDGFTEIKNKKIKGFVVFKDDEPVNAIPFDMLKFNDDKKEERESFSSAIDEMLFFHSKKDVETESDKKLKKINTIIKNQEDTIKKLEKQEVENREKADMIYAKYNEIDKLLKELNDVVKKHGFKEVKKKLKGHKVVKQINDKEKKVLVEV